MKKKKKIDEVTSKVMSKMAKKRWGKTTKKERSDIGRTLAQARWDKQKKEYAKKTK